MQNANTLNAMIETYEGMIRQYAIGEAPAHLLNRWTELKAALAEVSR